MEKLTSPYLPVIYFALALIICGARISGSGLSAGRILGLAVMAAGFSMWIAARRQLGQAFSQNPKATYLVTAGLYSKFRHPLYVSQVTTLIGLTIFFASPALALITAVVALFWLYRRRKEEELLAGKFGKQYEKYRQSTWF